MKSAGVLTTSPSQYVERVPSWVIPRARMVNTQDPQESAYPSINPRGLQSPTRDCLPVHQPPRSLESHRDPGSVRHPRDWLCVCAGVGQDGRVQRTVFVNSSGRCAEAIVWHGGIRDRKLLTRLTFQDASCLLGASCDIVFWTPWKEIPDRRNMKCG
jgi:hypothetical protein